MITVTAVIAASAVSQRGTISAGRSARAVAGTLIAAVAAVGMHIVAAVAAAGMPMAEEAESVTIAAAASITPSQRWRFYACVL